MRKSIVELIYQHIFLPPLPTAVLQRRKSAEDETDVLGVLLPPTVRRADLVNGHWRGHKSGECPCTKCNERNV